MLDVVALLLVHRFIFDSTIAHHHVMSPSPYTAIAPQDNSPPLGSARGLSSPVYSFPAIVRRRIVAE
jgi:hypothetical protein